MKIAFVAATTGDDWDEEALVRRRVTGALATRADVELLLASGPGVAEGFDGAVRVRRFPAMVYPTAWRRVIERSTVGAVDGEEALACSCAAWAGRVVAEDLPKMLQEEIVRIEGGHSPELYEFLSNATYDAVVFSGYRFASTCFGVRAVPAGSRVVLLAGARDQPSLGLRVYDPVFERAERVLVVTEGERALLRRRLGGAEERLRNVAFALRVHPLATETEPAGHDGRRYIAVVRDWSRPAPLARLFRLATWLSSFEMRLCLLGPGTERLPLPRFVSSPLAASRLDLWRWMSRALAVLDPEPHRLLGREVLETMMYGVPVVTDARGGAAREHAELGNGGLWYRDEAELRACVRALFDEERRRRIGSQGREYAEESYGDSDGFADRAWKAVVE